MTSWPPAIAALTLVVDDLDEARSFDRRVFDLPVDDVDATCARLRDLGVPLLNGPVDRPCGPRTASFRDPGGHVWEVAR